MDISEKQQEEVANAAHEYVIRNHSNLTKEMQASIVQAYVNGFLLGFISLLKLRSMAS